MISFFNLYLVHTLSDNHILLADFQLLLQKHGKIDINVALGGCMAIADLLYENVSSRVELGRIETCQAVADTLKVFGTTRFNLYYKKFTPLCIQNNIIRCFHHIILPTNITINYRFWTYWGY